mmetsp:Transcript_68410/g.157134  ORF Transcript_68410/g.157134 Transcript_68410/m.157134 type:complete len:116 (-) Transcript_68410:11-358(-)
MTFPKDDTTMHLVQNNKAVVHVEGTWMLRSCSRRFFGSTDTGSFDLSAAASRLVRTCSSSPWMLLMGLSALISAWNVLEMIFSRPYLLALPFLCPPKYRRQAGMAFFMVLLSGFI